MTKYKLITFCAYISVIAIATYQANPNFYFIGDDYEKILHRPAKAPASLIKKIPSTCEAIDQYRHSTTRSGFSQGGYPKPDVKIEQHIFPLNVGIHGASKASPVVDDTGIYIGSDTGFFWKMNFAGEVLWTFYAANSKNGFHGTAAVDDKKVYIGAYNGFIYALDKITGDISWANPVGDFVGASPLLADGALYISVETDHPNGLVAKLDCNSGETHWVSQWLGGHSHSSPTYDPQTNLIMTGANSGRAFAFDGDSGKTAWDLRYDGPIKGTLLAHKGVAYFGSWDKKYHAVDIKSGKKLWAFTVGGRIQTSLTLVPSKDYGITNTPIGKLIAIDLKTGELAWSYDHGDKNHYASVLVTKSKNKDIYYVWSRCGKRHLCVVNASNGKLLNKVKLPGGFTSVPVAYQDKILISLVDNHGMVILQ